MVERTELVKRLAGIKFKRDLVTLLDAEGAFQKAMTKYQGYDALSAAFIRFFLETGPSFNTDIVPKVKKLVTAEHSILVQKLVHAFHTIRAAQTAAHNGYPLQGLTLLRNVYDDCVLAAAVMHQWTTFDKLIGHKEGEAFDANLMRKNRIALERTIRRKMDGSESGLSKETRYKLGLVDMFYDAETHGGQVSSAYNQGWLLGRNPLSTIPIFREEVAQLFLNRYIETAWMVHRLLPFMQLPEAAFSEEWATKWKVIDQSFSEMVLSVFHTNKLTYFKAFCEFMGAKFSFNETDHFPT